MYTYSATVNTTDLAGKAWDTINVTGANPSEFEVTSSVNLSSTTLWLGTDPLTGDLIQYPNFRITTNTTGKVIVNPAVFQLGELMEMPGANCTDGSATYSFTDNADDLVVQLPTDFGYQPTGPVKRPLYVQVYAGELPADAVFNYKNPNLVDTAANFGTAGADVTSKVGQGLVTCPNGSLGTCVGINLKALGTLGSNYKIYVRGKAAYNSTVANASKLYNFASTAHVDNRNSSNPASPADNSSSYQACGSTSGTQIPDGNGGCVEPQP